MVDFTYQIPSMICIVVDTTVGVRKHNAAIDEGEIYLRARG